MWPLIFASKGSQTKERRVNVHTFFRLRNVRSSGLHALLVLGIIDQNTYTSMEQRAEKQSLENLCMIRDLTAQVGLKTCQNIGLKTSWLS